MPIHKAKASKGARLKARKDAAKLLVQVKILHPVMHWKPGHVVSVSKALAVKLANMHKKDKGPVRALSLADYEKHKAAKAAQHVKAVADAAAAKPAAKAKAAPAADK
jgi:hypothetical protein